MKGGCVLMAGGMPPLIIESSNKITGRARVKAKEKARDGVTTVLLKIPRCRTLCRPTLFPSWLTLRRFPTKAHRL